MHNVIDTAKEKGWNEGLAEGIEQGIEKVAMSMKENGLSVNEIAKITGLSEEIIDLL